MPFTRNFHFALSATTVYRQFPLLTFSAFVPEPKKLTRPAELIDRRGPDFPSRHAPVSGVKRLVWSSLTIVARHTSMARGSGQPQLEVWAPLLLRWAVLRPGIGTTAFGRVESVSARADVWRQVHAMTGDNSKARRTTNKIPEH